MKPFLAVYTNRVKSYCDRKFFDRVNQICDYSGITTGLIIDNSFDDSYYHELMKMTDIPVCHIEVPKQEYQFQHNVIESLKLLRESFLNSDCDWFFIMESDVIAPIEIIQYFERFITLENTILKSEQTAGIFGAIYYHSFHEYKPFIYQTHHVLSGCTMYKRELIEKYPFRIDLKENEGAFPDSWICYDSGKEYSFYNIPVICQHMRHPARHDRGQGLLNEN